MSKKKNPDFTVTTTGEARTANGQLITFSCPPAKLEEVKEFINKNIESIQIPLTKPCQAIAHGGYGAYSRYEIKQHEYAANQGAYIEVLEIKNPPDNRGRFIVNEYDIGRGYRFTEWQDLDQARNAFGHFWSVYNGYLTFDSLSGFKRQVICGELTPWFYAIGDEQLIGDYCLPENLQDDPVYRLGRKFIVWDKEKLPVIKTCLGTRFANERDYSGHEYYGRLVYWDDGSSWYEPNMRDQPPRPLLDNELWLTEAVEQFKRFLAGRQIEFSINLFSGHRFVGKLELDEQAEISAAGDYLVTVNFQDGKTPPKHGWINDFEPTPETPNIIAYVTEKFKKDDLEVANIAIEKKKKEKKGKAWSGVFYSIKQT